LLNTLQPPMKGAARNASASKPATLRSRHPDHHDPRKRDFMSVINNPVPPPKSPTPHAGMVFGGLVLSRQTIGRD
jgi:hypothetical protein